MKQVLLAPQSTRRHSPSHHNRTVPPPLPPILMWMSDDTQLGDIFLFHRKPWVVSNVYTTTFPRSCTGEQCARTERPHKHSQAGVVLDHHGDSTHPGN